MTRDIGVLFPIHDKKLVTQLIDQVGEELKLPTGNHAWLNDGISFFGLQTKSNNIIFQHSHLALYSADWHALLGIKLSGAWRRDSDFNDAIHILRQIGTNNKKETLTKSLKYKNFSPYIDDHTFKKRFDRTWKDAFEI